MHFCYYNAATAVTLERYTGHYCQAANAEKNALKIVQMLQGLRPSLETPIAGTAAAENCYLLFCMISYMCFCYHMCICCIFLHRSTA